MMGMSGKDVEIIFTGLRHGEKLHEDLFSSTEDANPPSHPRVSQASVDALPPERLSFAAWIKRMPQSPAKELDMEIEGIPRRQLSQLASRLTQAGS